MNDTETALDRFFESFQQANRSGDLSSLTALFADTFLAAGPQGAKCIQAAVFAPFVANRKQLFDSLGCRPAELVSLTETELDTRYVLARTQWRFVFEPAHARPETISIESSYLLDAAAEPFRIVAYLAHQDIMAILRERGLLAEAQ